MQTPAPVAGRPRPAADVPSDTRSRLSLLRTFRRDPLGLLLGLREQRGTIVRLKGLPFPVYLVSDPTAIREALTMTGTVHAKGVPTPGDLHKRQRRLLQPLFHRDRISEYAAAFAEIGSPDDGARPQPQSWPGTGSQDRAAAPAAERPPGRRGP